MGSYNFQERFVPFIQDGTKTHTIRGIRKHPQKIGALMHLFSGLRRIKPALRIIPAPACTDVKTILILQDERVCLIDAILNKDEAEDLAIVLANAKELKNFPSFIHRFLNDDEKDKLAWADGFRNENKGYEKNTVFCFVKMFNWFAENHDLPFAGHINYWK